MSIATGSASEVEYQLILACDLNYMQDETYRELDQQVNEVKRKFNSFIQMLTAQERGQDNFPKQVQRWPEAVVQSWGNCLVTDPKTLNASIHAKTPYRPASLPLIEAKGSRFPTTF